ncbi:MAG: MBL fold metallo-hydrolase [Candidatus Pacebacteria bacterium]|nr:MBL fold metallo-hydrolase [Candidatus Paceibacterota bacterium]
MSFSIILILLYLIVTFDSRASNNAKVIPASPVQVIPISHATFILKWDNKTIYIDPVGDRYTFENETAPDIILVTDIHGDHLSTDVLSQIIGKATLVVPSAVGNILPDEISTNAKILNNGEVTVSQGFKILAIPMYNLPESEDSKHVRGRGNGYLIEHNGFRVYIAGDTAGIQEMRDLRNIDIAFIPMNLPYTMSYEEAADAVLEFKPKQVYPYHYRSEGGERSILNFKKLIKNGDGKIEVILKNWYPFG